MSSMGPTKFSYPRIKTTCASCVFIEKQSCYAKPCKQLGILATSKPCPKFILNPYLIKYQEQNASKQLKELMTSLKQPDLWRFSALLAQEVKTRQQGYHFGQTVYVCLFTDDYISNYASAAVISANKEYVYVQGVNGFRGMLFHSSVLTISQWKKKKLLLQNKGRLKDPKYKSYTTAVVDTRKLAKDNWEPVNIGKLSKKPRVKSRVIKSK